MMGIVPCVTTTLNSPREIRSDSASMSASVAEGELRIEYEGGASVSLGGTRSLSLFLRPVELALSADVSETGTLWEARRKEKGSAQ